jgi:macrolide-specific efflux system membrane fusion protein
MFRKDTPKKAFEWLKKRSKKQKVFGVLILAGLGWWGYKNLIANKQTKVTYQTETAQKGTLINSISGSGTITSGNNTSVNTKVSGTVSKVYVTNGDTVKKGQKIAEAELDDYAKERQTAAWVNYLEATEAVKEAANNKAVADIEMWKSRQAVLDAQEAVDDMEEDDTNPATHAVYTDGERAIITKTLDQSRLAFSVTEAKYLNSGADIANANAKVAAALRNYQENSATIAAPADGVISDLALAPGLVISADSTTSNTNGATIVSAKTIGKISNPKGQLIATVSLSEVDIISVKANQKVTLTLDAFSDMTFTGKVLSVDTTGGTTSGVTSYPVTILLDPVTVDIYPNMAVNAEIITKIKTDVILVSSTAVTTTNGVSTVQVKKDGKISQVQVETGDANDSQTEITSGINEGDEVVTSVITAQSNSSSSNSTTTSPFSGLGRTSTGSSSSGSKGNSIMIQGGPPGGF